MAHEQHHVRTKVRGGKARWFVLCWIRGKLVSRFPVKSRVDALYYLNRDSKYCTYTLEQEE